MIIQVLDFDAFVDAFERRGRGTQFSRAALYALYNFLSDDTDDTGEPYELDVIALCCDYQEFAPVDLIVEFAADLFPAADQAPDTGALSAATISALDDLADTHSRAYQALLGAGALPCNNGHWVVPAYARF